MFRKKRLQAGSAFLIAIGVLGVLIITVFLFSQSTVRYRWTTVISNNEKKAEECAESASNLVFRLIQESMNDHKLFYQSLSNPGDFFKNWFTFFRIPTVIVGGNLDAVQVKSNVAASINNGEDIRLDLFNNTLYQAIYENGIKYDSDDPNSPLMLMGKMFESMGGKTRVRVKGRISEAFGVLSKNPDYEVGGITVPLTGVTGFLANLLNDINSEPLSFSYDLTDLIPNTSIFSGLPSVEIVTITFATIPPTFYLIPIPIASLVESMLGALGLDLTWRGLAQSIIGDNLSVSIDLNDLKVKIQDRIFGLLPEQISLFKGNLSWGVTTEKQGILELKVDVEYQPSFPGNGPTIKRTLVAQREFRVADIQPIAPDYSFFVANSAKLYETPSVENAENWQGDDEINFNSGDGVLTIHNLPPLSSIFNSLSGIMNLNLKEINRKVLLPGMVRVNGTHPMTINISMIDPDDLSNVRLMEMAALLFGGSDGHSHSIVPRVEQVMYNPAGGDGWDWPYYGDSGLWIPTFLPRYARTLLFGNYHLEFPLTMRVEGFLKKRYSHIKFLIVKIYIPPFPPWFNGFGFAFPWPWKSTEKEPYGFCRFPPYESEAQASTRWDPDNSHSFPANLYSTQQYLKKAGYYYATSAEFKNDIDNRSKEIDGEKVFVCDGVTFVNDNLWFNEPIKVMGRGIIIAVGNIHLGANIQKREFDEDGNPTIFSLVARNGAIVNRFNDIEVNACMYADQGIINTLGTNLKIKGNLVVNKFDRSLCQGKVDVYYQSKHTRSSLLSMVRSIAKYDPTRYHVTVSNRIKKFEFVKN